MDFGDCSIPYSLFKTIRKFVGVHPLFQKKMPCHEYCVILGSCRIILDYFLFHDLCTFSNTDFYSRKIRVIGKFFFITLNQQYYSIHYQSVWTLNDLVIVMKNCESDSMRENETVCTLSFAFFQYFRYKGNLYVAAVWRSSTLIN